MKKLLLSISAIVALAACTFTIPVSLVFVHPDKLEMTVGEQKTIKVTVLPSDATETVFVWSSSDSNVAEVGVNDGVVSAIAPGQATITVETADGSVRAHCAVTVKEAPGGCEGEGGSPEGGEGDNGGSGEGGSTERTVVPDGDGTREHPLNSSQANVIGAPLSGGEVTSKKYYIRGYVSEITSKDVTGDFRTYHNMTFYITASPDLTGETFYCYQLNWASGVKFAEYSDLQVGDDVVIYAPITKYIPSNGGDPIIETPGKGVYYLVSVNGKDTAGESDGGDTGSTTEVTELVSYPVPGDWLELPQTYDGDGRYFVSHNMKLGSRVFRNYSYYLSEKDILSHWVAYPLNSWTIGSGSRTDVWGIIDPKVPRANQAVLNSGFGTGYDRGHQCPSADRYTPGANEATFYGTNMTPQNSTLNQQVWANLEKEVRSWSYSMDTVYVVTGCYTVGSTGYRLDSEGKHITIPVGYYKALLGFSKRGNVGVKGGSDAYEGSYSAVAFYFENRSYGSVQAEFPTIINENSMTVRELEAKVGENFFPNLVKVLGEDKSNSVETSIDSFWKL